MAGRKKLKESINGIPRKDGELLVQKSQNILNLWRSGLSLAEFKIMDVYLARIDSHRPERRLVKFTKGEIEHLLGVKKINKATLEKRLEHLLGTVVDVPDIDYKRGFHKITLFDESYGEEDDNGTWTVHLECTEKAMKYFFNIENLGYLRYKLRCVININSRYSYLLFLYIENNRRRKSWEVDLDKLREILNCNDEKYAKEFKYFNRDILMRSQKELKEKTECRFDYEPIKKGRRITKIRFTVATLSDLEKKGKKEDPQISLDEWQAGENQNREQICQGLSDPVFDRLSEDQLRALIASAEEKGYTGKDAALHLKTCLAAAAEKKAAHPYQYVQKMLANEKKKKGKKEGATESTGTKFNDNFTQRNYDFNSLEAELLAAQEKE